jgi:hypothetical protein
VIRRAAAVFAFALVACNRGAEAPDTPAPSTAAPPAATSSAQDLPHNANRKHDRDGENLLNIAFGAALVSRTAELDLEHSAVHAIDGMATTEWISPAGDSNHTLVFSFGAPVRVDRLGFATRKETSDLPEKIRFAASADGRTWREVLTTIPKSSAAPQISKVPAFEANFLRVETVEPKKPRLSLASVHALGEEIYPAELRSFDGCWTINGERAFIAQRGARITGIIGAPPRFTAIDGGTDGRVARVMWLRGPMWGYAAITLSADGRHLSALTFHQNPQVVFVGRAWIGERCESTAQLDVPPPVHFLNQAGHWSLTALAFDDREQLIETMSRDALDATKKLIASAPKQQRFRIISHEFRYTPEENRQRTVARIASLRAALEANGFDMARIDLLASGDESELADPTFAVQRLLWSRIELQLQ